MWHLDWKVCEGRVEVRRGDSRSGLFVAARQSGRVRTPALQQGSSNAWLKSQGLVSLDDL